jgi:hypothetical protein
MARSRLRARLSGFARGHGSPHSASFAPSCPPGTVIPPSTNFLCPASANKGCAVQVFMRVPSHPFSKYKREVRPGLPKPSQEDFAIIRQNSTL